jgi:hypothetical protein
MAITSAQRKMLTFGLIPVLAIVLGGAAVTVATIRGRLDYAYSQTVDTPSEGLHISANMEVQVAPSTDRHTRVRVSGTYADHEPVVELKAENDTLNVEAHCQGSSCRLDLTIEVPTSTQVSVDASEASVDLVELTGPVDVTAQNGSVNGVRLRSESVTVNSRSGSMDLGFDQPPQSVDATATNGSVHVLVPGTAAYAIDAAAVHGSTELNLDNDLSSFRELHLRATNGSVTVDSN